MGRCPTGARILEVPWSEPGCAPTRGTLGGPWSPLLSPRPGNHGHASWFWKLGSQGPWPGGRLVPMPARVYTGHDLPARAGYWVGPRTPRIQGCPPVTWEGPGLQPHLGLILSSSHYGEGSLVSVGGALVWGGGWPCLSVTGQMWERTVPLWSRVPSSWTVATSRGDAQLSLACRSAYCSFKPWWGAAGALQAMTCPAVASGLVFQGFRWVSGQVDSAVVAKSKSGHLWGPAPCLRPPGPDCQSLARGAAGALAQDYCTCSGQGQLSTWS